MVSSGKIFIFNNMYKFYYFEFSAGRVGLTRLPKAIRLSAKLSDKTAGFLSAAYRVPHIKKALVALQIRSAGPEACGQSSS